MSASTYPVTPSSSTSGTDPHGRASTGVPHASDSAITSPKGSGQSIGKTIARALPRNSDFSASVISPTYSMNLPSIRGLTCAW